MADKISDRRQSAINCFLVFNSILISVFGIVSGIGSMARHHMWQYLIPLAGLLVSTTWAALISANRDLQSRKFVLYDYLEQFFALGFHSDIYIIYSYHYMELVRLSFQV